MSELKTNTSFEEIAKIFREKQSFAVLSHVRPDGDAIGSQVAVGQSLKLLGKDVRIINEHGTPDNLEFLPGSDMVESTSGEPVDVEVVIACDTATRPRLGDSTVASVDKVPLWINIDHHISNPGYGDYHYIDSRAPATGEILFDLLKSQELPMDDVVRDNLYVAISTDTGSFQYPSTTANTYRIGAEMIDMGLDVGAISQKTYEDFPLRRIRLLGRLLEVLEIGNDGRRASWALPLSVVDELGTLPEDTEGLIEHVRAIRGVVVAVFFEELRDGGIRISTRSKDRAVDMCVLCKKFNGGGHSLAAGARLETTLEEAQKQVLAAVDEALDGID